jgi:hypothetical protein
MNLQGAATMINKAVKAFVICLALWVSFVIAYNVIPIVRGNLTASKFLKHTAKQSYSEASQYILNKDKQEWVSGVERLRDEGLFLVSHSQLNVGLDDNAVEGQTMISLTENGVTKNYRVYIMFGGSRFSPIISDLQYIESDGTLQKWVKTVITAPAQ